MNMTEAWSAIETRLPPTDDGQRGCLRRPVAPSELQAAVQLTGQPWPVDLRESLERHNGEVERGGVLMGWRLLPAAEIAATWATMNELQRTGEFRDGVPVAGAGVRPVWWSAAWLPISDSGSGDHHCIDLDPADGGRVGQVVVFLHDDGLRRVQSDSLASLLGGLATGLAAGDFTADALGRVRIRRRPR